MDEQLRNRIGRSLSATLAAASDAALLPKFRFYYEDGMLVVDEHIRRPLRNGRGESRVVRHEFRLDPVEPEPFEDGIYRIDGALWEREDGHWSSVVDPERIWDDASLVERWGEPVRIQEVEPGQVVFDYEAVPTAASLRALLHSAGTEVSMGDYCRVDRFIKTLQPIDEERMR